MQVSVRQINLNCQRACAAPVSQMSHQCAHLSVTCVCVKQLAPSPSPLGSACKQALSPITSAAPPQLTVPRPSTHPGSPFSICILCDPTYQAPPLSAALPTAAVDAARQRSQLSPATASPSSTTHTHLHQHRSLRAPVAWIRCIPARLSLASAATRQQQRLTEGAPWIERRRCDPSNTLCCGNTAAVCICAPAPLRKQQRSRTVAGPSAPTLT